MLCTSVRTLVLGVDPAGRIVQHDRDSAEVLDSPQGGLLGAHLADLVTGAASSGPPLDGLLEAVRDGHEATAVMALRTHRAAALDAVVTVTPMRSAGGNLAALVTLRMPPPGDEQFLDPVLIRHALLEDNYRQIGASLDLDQMARSLIGAVVPNFANSAALLVLESVAASDEPAPPASDDSALVRRVALASDGDDSDWRAAFPMGEVLRYPLGTPYGQCMATGKPVLEPIITAADAHRIAQSLLRHPVARLLAGASLLVLPVNTQDASLGFLACVRRPGMRPFDEYDTEIGMEFASRAAIFIENARRYNRERATALTLQRSLLPAGLSAPSSVEVGHRYLPGGQLIEVGGDWYESIALPGARVALVVGDVAGHGVRAAVTMGRLRTAIQTLAMLELPPAESLQHLNELMQAMGHREPHFATCAYAVYDAVTGTCEIASAGHLPPLLVRPDGTSEYLDVAPSPPLGVVDELITSHTFDIDDGSLLVLYTDGLVENRGRDIDDGLARLRTTFGPGATDRSMDDLCRATIASAFADHQRDDIAVLIARLRRADATQQECWVLPGDLTSARQARALVKEPLERWNLTSLVPTTQLLVSELVTNAIRYTEGAVTVRLIEEGTLVCEVVDSSPALPRLRHAAGDDERGRGLQIVSQLSHRWGARRTPDGKVVWCEQVPWAAPAAPTRALTPD